MKREKVVKNAFCVCVCSSIGADFHHHFGFCVSVGDALKKHWKMMKSVDKFSELMIKRGLLASTIFRFSLCSISEPNLYERRLHKCCEDRVSVIPVLEEWVADFGEIRQQTLQRFITNFKKHRRFTAALQIAEWMSSSKNRFAITPGLAAVQLDLLWKVHGIEQAEKYFNGLQDSLVDFRVYLALMNCYAEANYLAKAEATMICMKKVNCWSALSYNVMLRLYSLNRKHEKLNALVQEMQVEGIAYDKITYKILLHAYARSDLERMEKLLEKMEADCQVSVDFHSYAAAAKGYLKAGDLDKAFVLLKKAESLIGAVHGRSSAYLSLMTYYATMQRKEEVYRIWNLLPDFTNNAYVAMISSLAKLDDLDGASKILEEWERRTKTFDIQIPNLVIRAYCKKGDVRDAEIILKRLVDIGEEPNAQTLSHMALGYFKSGEMKKAIETKKKAFLANLPGWKPNLIVVEACLEYLQNRGDTYGIHEMLMLLEKYRSSLQGVEELTGRFWKPKLGSGNKTNDCLIPYFTSTVGCS